MPLFEILTPRDSADPLQAQLIKDEFSWSAALVPPLWALLHQMWLEVFGWCVGLVLIVVAGLFIGNEAAFWLYALFAVWIGLAAADLRIAALRRAGYRTAGNRIAADEMLAERDWLQETAK